jgi:hypothetical protein
MDSAFPFHESILVRLLVRLAACWTFDLELANWPLIYEQRSSDAMRLCAAPPPLAVDGPVTLSVCGWRRPGSTSMADADDVRRLALALPDVVEIDSDGFDFRVADKDSCGPTPSADRASHASSGLTSRCCM